MMHLIKLLLFISSATAFVSPPTRGGFLPSVPTSTAVHQNPSGDSISKSTVDTLLASADGFVQKFLEAGGGDDPVGTRGEAYFFAQAILIVAIALGGIPILGDYLQIFAGPGLLAMGVGVLAITASNMGESIAPWPKPNGQGLVRDGLYGQMRHPMYFGLLSTMAGFSIMTGSIERLLLTAVLYAVISMKTDYEEEELMKAYPEYEQYQTDVTSKFVPMFWVDLWRNNKDGK